jgi:hypothetical protein
MPPSDPLHGRVAVASDPRYTDVPCSGNPSLPSYYVGSAAASDPRLIDEFLCSAGDMRWLNDEFCTGLAVQGMASVFFVCFSTRNLRRAKATLVSILIVKGDTQARVSALIVFRDETSEMHPPRVSVLALGTYAISCCGVVIAFITC